MDVARWITAHGGIVHRQQVLDAGISVYRLRAAVTRGDVERIRRNWVSTDAAPPALLRAAQVSGRLTCVSAAGHRGWWMPPGLADATHVTVKPGARPPEGEIVAHWSVPLVPLPTDRLMDAVPDILERVANCLPFEQALVIWESALRLERLHPDAVGRVAWRSPAARRLAAVATGRSDSGLETIFVVRLRPWGVRVRQQVPIAGHRVDVLIGDRLVVQLDGFAFHSSPADRQRDLDHDRELTARGYTVLRFTYRDVVADWPAVERTIADALAQERHLTR